MAQAVNTGSTIGLDSGRNKTSTSLSTNILITIPTATGQITVGAVQTLQISEKRAIKQIDEVGTDGHVDSTPHQSTNISGSCQRVRFDKLRVAEAFGRGFIHAASQVYPFDIVIFDRQKSDPGSQVATIIKNVWIEGIEYTYQASDWVITDNMTWQAEYIYSHLNSNGSTPAAVGGERGIKHMGGGTNGIGVLPATDGTVFSIEQLVDSGQSGRRGSLDASGLIDLAGELF